MRLNPALEETRRTRQADRSVLDRLQVHAGKPARIDVVTDLGAQTPLHPSPALLIHVRHFIVSLSLEVSTASVARLGGEGRRRAEDRRNIYSRTRLGGFRTAGR